MALTENTFTSTELEAAVTANPGLVAEISKVAEKNGGYLAFDKTSRETFENNISTRTKTTLTQEHASAIEKDVEEITGVKKISPDEKYYDYMKRVLSTTNETAKSLDVKIKALEGKSDITAAERDQLVALQNLQKVKETEITTLKDSHQSEITKLKAENKIYSEIGKVDAKMKKTPELQEAISIVREKVIGEMITSAKLNNGVMVFFGADGKALTNTDASFMNAEQVYASKMDKYIDKAKTQGGAGGDGKGNPDDNAINQFKTQVEADRYLSTKGLIAGTLAHSAERKRLAIEKLPLI